MNVAVKDFSKIWPIWSSINCTGMFLPVNRTLIRDVLNFKGYQTLEAASAEEGIKLAIEPLHPMYADDRSAINTMAQAHAVSSAGVLER
jgi:hypothetical protein